MERPTRFGRLPDCVEVSGQITARCVQQAEIGPDTGICCDSVAVIGPLLGALVIVGVAGCGGAP